MLKIFSLPKTLFLAAALSAFSGSAVAQNCDAQWADSGFVYPFTYLFPCMVQGESFSSSFMINMPNMFHGIIQMDTMFFDSVTGLPAGITWSMSPLFIPGDSGGCITLSGTTNIDSGTYNLTFYCHATVTSQSTFGTRDLSYTELLAVGDAPIPSYSVQVIHPGDSCEPLDSISYILAIPQLSNASTINLYPNPLLTGSWKVTVSNDVPGCWAEVYDLQGRILSSTPIRYQYFTIPGDNLSPGIYLLRITSGDYSVVKKLVKE